VETGLHRELEAADDRRLSELLEQQQAGILALARSRTPGAMQAYQQGLLRKAQVLHEAVRRGSGSPSTVSTRASQKHNVSIPIYRGAQASDGRIWKIRRKEPAVS